MLKGQGTVEAEAALGPLEHFASPGHAIAEGVTASSPSPNSSGESAPAWTPPLCPQDRRTDGRHWPRWHTEEELRALREAAESPGPR